MLSSSDIERLITVKRCEIIREKSALGLARSTAVQIKDADDNNVPNLRRVQFDKLASNGETEDKEEREDNTREEDRHNREIDERIPPDLERYIRRYIGLPVMLKAGEYSPNNPLIRAERSSGDVLLGLGEYERRRNTLRKLRQQQYREYLDQQAKKKQEEKERAERERREREEKEREREERDRERERERELLERDRESPRRRMSVGCGNSPYYINKVDTGVQVDSIRCPLSVAVQTDDADLYQMPTSPTKTQLTEAERELSPRNVAPDERRLQPAWGDKWKHDSVERRRSYGDFDEGPPSPRRSGSRFPSDLRHSHTPSIFDADAIHMRNLQAEKEAAERRQFYQQELKNQIMEQQRIKEERKTREKMLEQAEMRRLEEQLRMLKMAQEREVGKQREINAAINAENLEYTRKRSELQKEIDSEQTSLFRAATHPPLQPLRMTTSHSDSFNPTKLPFYYPRVKDKPFSMNDKPFSTNDKPFSMNDKPFSTNIPDDSIFSPNYDVDSYLRKNLNFKNVNRFDAKKVAVNDKNKFDTKHYDGTHKITELHDRNKFNSNVDDVFGALEEKSRNKNLDLDKKVIVEKALVHAPQVKLPKLCLEDDTPIPVLRHSPVSSGDKVDNKLSDAMKKVEDKWKVPAVQKNILRSLPNDEGKNVSILTQLGSIRRQLQLEQLKLDRMGNGDA